MYEHNDCMSVRTRRCPVERVGLMRHSTAGTLHPVTAGAQYHWIYRHHAVGLPWRSQRVKIILLHTFVITTSIRDEKWWAMINSWSICRHFPCVWAPSASVSWRDYHNFPCITCLLLHQSIHHCILQNPWCLLATILNTWFRKAVPFSFIPLMTKVESCQSCLFRFKWKIVFDAPRKIQRKSCVSFWESH